MTSVIGISERVVYVTLRLCSILTLHGWRNIKGGNVHHIRTRVIIHVCMCARFSFFGPMVFLV